MNLPCPSIAPLGMLATSVLQPAQRGGRQRHSPTWVSVTYSTLAARKSRAYQTWSRVGHIPWLGLAMVCGPQIQIPPSHCPVPPWPFHTHQNQQYVLSEQNKPECFKFWSGWFSSICRGHMGLGRMAISSPPPYLADLIGDACLGGVFTLFPSPPEEKESLLLHTLKFFNPVLNRFNFYHYFPIILTAPLHGSPSTEQSWQFPTAASHIDGHHLIHMHTQSTINLLKYHSSPGAMFFFPRISTLLAGEISPSN